MSATVISAEEDYKEGVASELDGRVWKSSNGAKVCSMSLELEALCFERQRIAQGCFDSVPGPQKKLQKKLLQDIPQPVQGQYIEKYRGEEILTPPPLPSVPQQNLQALQLQPPSFQQVASHQHPYLRSPSSFLQEPLQLSPITFDSALRPLYAAPAHGGVIDIHTSDQSGICLTEDALLNSGYNKQAEAAANGGITANYTNPTNASYIQIVNDHREQEGINTTLHSQNIGANGGNFPQQLQLMESSSTCLESLNMKCLTPVNTKDLLASPLDISGANKLMSSPFLSLNGNTIWVSPGNESIVTTPRLSRRHHFEVLSTTNDASGGGGGVTTSDCNSTYTNNIDTMTTGILSDGVNNTSAAEVQGWNLSSVLSPCLQSVFLFPPLPFGQTENKFV